MEFERIACIKVEKASTLSRDRFLTAFEMTKRNYRTYKSPRFCFGNNVETIAQTLAGATHTARSGNCNRLIRYFSRITHIIFLHLITQCLDIR
jgi:hypothetical protein